MTYIFLNHARSGGESQHEEVPPMAPKKSLPRTRPPAPEGFSPSELVRYHRERRKHEKAAALLEPARLVAFMRAGKQPAHPEAAAGRPAVEEAALSPCARWVLKQLEREAIARVRRPGRPVNFMENATATPENDAERAAVRAVREGR